MILLAGTVGFITLKLTKPMPPEKRVVQARALVRVMTVQKEDMRAIVEESGAVRPKTELDIIAEVSGRIIKHSPNLHVGYFVTKNELLVEIDSREYVLNVAEFKARIAQSRAEIAKTIQQRANLLRNIEVEKKKLELSKSELERVSSLLNTGSIAQSAVDKQEIETKQMEASVLNQINALELLASQEDLIKANIEATEAQLENARIKLEKTKIYAPFDGRVRSESVDPNEFVQVGTKLAQIYDISAVEVVVHVPPSRMAKWIDIPKEDLPDSLMARVEKANELIKKLGPSGTVTLRVGETEYTWPCKVSRLEGFLDESTRTVPMVLEVSHPFKGVVPGQKPPLVPGMFVRVEILGKVYQDVAKIPRSAIHDGSAYVVSDGKLEIRKLEIPFTTKEYAVVAKGLENGDKVILSPIAVPIPGMPVRVLEDIAK